MSSAIKEKIIFDLKEAQKTKQEIIVAVLRLLNAAIHNKEIEKRTKLIKTFLHQDFGGQAEQDESKLEELGKLTDEEIIEVISSEAKKRKEAIEQYEKGKREDLALQEKRELEILIGYLPEQLSEERIRQMIKEFIQKTGAGGPQDFGKIMNALMPKLKGKAEGNLVSKLVREELSS